MMLPFLEEGQQAAVEPGGEPLPLQGGKIKIIQRPAAVRTIGGVEMPRQIAVAEGAAVIPGRKVNAIADEGEGEDKEVLQPRAFLCKEGEEERPEEGSTKVEAKMDIQCFKIGLALHRISPLSP